MSPEEKELLEKTFDLAKENNKILTKLNHSRVAGIIWRTFYWVVIIALSFGAFYFIQPYVEVMKGMIPGLDEALNNFRNATE